MSWLPAVVWVAPAVVGLTLWLLRRGSTWQLDDEGIIVSSYHGRRYQLHIDSYGRKKRAEIARQREQRLQNEMNQAGAGKRGERPER